MSALCQKPTFRELVISDYSPKIIDDEAIWAIECDPVWPQHRHAFEENPLKISPVTAAKRRRYSINSSARSSNCGGVVRPSAFAVFRLMINSNFVGC
jgi:hypothetical protein